MIIRTCNNCGKVIEGYTENQVRHLMNKHSASRSCRGRGGSHMGNWIQDMLGIKDEDLHKPMFVRTKITIDKDTLVEMAHAFGKGMRGDELTSEEKHYVREINKNPKLKQIVEGEYKMIEDGR